MLDWKRFKFSTAEAKGLIASIVLHLLILGPLAFLTMTNHLDDLQVAIETVFSEERPPEEFTRELTADTQISETLNVMEAGGAVTEAVGGSASSVATSQQKIEQSEQLKDPNVQVNVGAIDLPGVEMLGNDLGEGEVTGEVGAAVEGYGAALSRVSQEIIRMMREERVLVVWLFDESESMKDDQQQIKEQFHKIYEELGIASKVDQKIKSGGKELLLTAVHGFGKDVHVITPKPTDDTNQIKAAIDKIQIDTTGRENTLAAINAAIEKYRPIAQAGKRKLAIIVVSDESGNDDAPDSDLLDKTIQNAKRLKSPIYILGRESIFGYPYGRIRYIDPKYGLAHDLRIDRGPETADPECLQFDGFHERWDSYMSGFGPYTQARLCKESGGIFFLLPSEDENLIGQAAVDQRKFAFFDLKEYTPDLSPRRQYRQERDKSKFRATMWGIIKTLNPHTNGKIRIDTWHYPVDHQKFQTFGKQQFERAVEDMKLLNAAIMEMEKIRPLRDSEESQRWRAHYDLMLGQLMTYRVRLFQFMLAADAHAKNQTKPKDPKSNEWHIERIQAMLPPDDAQIKKTGVDFKELQAQEKEARQQFEFVLKTHPRTPWAYRAQTELNQGFGIRFVEWFRDPRYDKLDIKLPDL